MFNHVATMRRMNKSSHCLRLFLLMALVSLTSCNRMMTPPAAQVLKDADAKVATGDYLEAITLYESSLDNSTRAADIHFKLALLYDEKMSDPLNAMHHFKRYLTLAPSGPRAAEVKNLMKREELTLVTTLSGDSVVSRGEAARLKNENLELRKDLASRTAQLQAAANSTKEKSGATAPRADKAAGKNKKSGRSYVVQSGDTLASISRKFYNSSSGWKKIRDEEGNRFDDPGKLKPGQTVTIP